MLQMDWPTAFATVASVLTVCGTVVGIFIKLQVDKKRTEQGETPGTVKNNSNGNGNKWIYRELDALTKRTATVEGRMNSIETSHAAITTEIGYVTKGMGELKKEVKEELNEFKTAVSNQMNTVIEAITKKDKHEGS